MNILKKRYSPEENSAIVYILKFALLLLYVTFGMRGQYIEIEAAIVLSTSGSSLLY